MSALPSKADMCSAVADVRFGPIADMGPTLDEDSRFNATLSAKGYVWFWPKITAALTSKHHWLIIACDSCGTVVDLDLRVKPRQLEKEPQGSEAAALVGLPIRLEG